MRRFKIWGSVVLVLAVVAAGVWALWNFELRWRPKTIVRHQAEITRLLEQSGYVSPGLKGRPLYVLAYRDCAPCTRFREEVFPALHAAGVDTRVIMVARQAQSTPVERSTVAQIWITRDWNRLQAWESVAPQAWRGIGVPPADGDIARTAVVESGRVLVERLQPLLAKNGVKPGYPTLVWWNDEGEMRACACDRPQSYRFVRKELKAR
jgi:hypothetical protein